MPVASPTFNVSDNPYPIAGEAQPIWSCDPTLARAQQFAKFTLGKYVGPEFTRVVEAKGFQNLLNASAAIVGETAPFNVFPYLRSKTWKFPILSVYRTEGEFKQITNAKVSSACAVALEWILPPLSANEARYLLPFKFPVAQTLFQKFNQNADDDYDGYDGYSTRWGPYKEVQVRNVEYDLYLAYQSENAQDQVFAPMCRVTIGIEEESLWNLGDFSSLAGYTLDVTNDDTLTFTQAADI